MKALILIWRAPGPSAPRWTIEALFGRDKEEDEFGLEDDFQTSTTH
jgi:hypothetical protein